MAGDRYKALIVNMEARTAAFERGMRTVETRMGGLERAANTVRTAVRTMLPVLGTAVVASYVRGQIEAADATAKTADKVGVLTSELQELRHAGELSGVATGGLDKSLEMLGRRVGEAATGKGELLQVLRDYNISITDARGRTRSQAEILGDLADRVQHAGSAQERLNIANRAFGESGGDMVNLLRQGRDGIERMREEARRLGLVLDEDLLRQAEATNDALTRMQRATGAAGQRMVLSLAPGIAKAAEAAATLAPHLGKIAEFAMRFSMPVNLSALLDRFADRTPAQNLELLEARLASLQARIADLRQHGMQAHKDALMPGLLEEWKRVNDLIERLRANIEQKNAALATGAAEETNILRVLEKGWNAYGDALVKADVEAARRLIGDLAPANWLPAELEATESLMAAEAARAEGKERLLELEQRHRAGAAGWLPVEERHVDALAEAWRRQSEAIQEAERRAENYGRIISGSLASAAVHGGTFKSVLGGIAERFAQIVLDALLLRAIMGSPLGGVLRGLGVASAHGNAFQNGGVIPMARGGIVSRPTMAPMALMGEAGPEAVLPLQRGPGGNLGVAGAPVHVEIVNTTGQPARVERQPGSGNLRVLIGQAVADDLRGGGPVSRQLRDSWNLRPALAGR